jgi:predicted Zn-dependent protease
MKKVILSIAIMASVVGMTSVQQVNAAVEQPSISIVLDDSIVMDEDGFVEVQLEALNPAVQASVNALTQEYEIKSLKYNAEKQLTKVKLVKKDDQSVKKIYFDADGKEVQKDQSQKETEETESTMEQQAPSAEIFAAMQDDGFVNVKFEDLNEKVQAAVRSMLDQYDINVLQYDAEKKITKVTATNKEDQSEKIVYLDDEGKEVTLDAAPQSTTEAPRLL